MRITMGGRLVGAIALVWVAFAGCGGDRPADAYLDLVNQYCACQDRDCVDRARQQIDTFDVSRFTGDDFDTLLEASTRASSCVENLGELARPPAQGARR